MENPSARINTADIWKAITPDNSNDQPEYRALYVTSAGNVVAQDSQGNVETFPVVVGQILPIQATRITTSTTASLIGLN